MAQKIFQGVYRINGRLATLSSVKGFKVHDEQLFREGSQEFREWDPFHSKLAAAIARGLRSFPFQEGTRVLYLGAGNGVTPSFLSDILPKGTIYAVEFSPQSSRDLIAVSEKRENLLPIVADARFPERYSEVGEVDVLYEDVADKDQVRILIDNSDRYLKKGGIAMLAIKARSINSIIPPKQVFAKAITELRNHFEVMEKIDLGNFERDHMFLVLKKG